MTDGSSGSMAQTQQALVNASAPQGTAAGPPAPEPAAAAALAAADAAAADAAAAGPADAAAAPAGPVGKPPRPKPAKSALKPASAVLPAGPAEARNGQSDGPFTFSSPFEVAEELRQGATAAAGGQPQGAAVAAHAQQPGADSGFAPLPADAAAGLSEAMASGRLRRTISWSDEGNRAPLAQVVEYQPSEGRSTHSEDDWGPHASGTCLCCVQ